MDVPKEDFDAVLGRLKMSGELLFVTSSAAIISLEEEKAKCRVWRAGIQSYYNSSLEKACVLVIREIAISTFNGISAESLVAHDNARFIVSSMKKYLHPAPCQLRWN